MPNSLIFAAVLTVLLITEPVAAHVPYHCSTGGITQAQKEKRAAAQALRRAVQRQDPAAIHRRFTDFIQADAQQDIAHDRWVECVKGQ